MTLVVNMRSQKNLYRCLFSTKDEDKTKEAHFPFISLSRAANEQNKIRRSGLLLHILGCGYTVVLAGKSILNLRLKASNFPPRELG